MVPDSSDCKHDWFSPPGHSILGVMRTKGLSTLDLSHGISVSLSEAKQLLLGAKPIDDNIAEKLSVYLGGSATFWTARQAEFEGDLRSCVEREDVGKLKTIASQLPSGELSKLGWSMKGLSKEEKAFAFFGVFTVNDWISRYEHKRQAVAFRQSATFPASVPSTLAWLRQSECLASLLSCKTWDKAAFADALAGIRQLSRKKDPAKFFREIVETSSECGVAVVYVPTPKGCRASGATYFRDDGTAVMALSFRHLTDDHFWFTFFHEAAHLILHDKRALFLEDGEEATQAEEQEANEFAAAMLIPDDHLPEFRALPNRSKEIIRFARRIGISPGVVVGQMQHRGLLEYNQMNRLKRRFSTAELMNAI